MLATVTKYAAEVNDADNVTEAVTNAFRRAVTEPRGATAVVLPADVAATATGLGIDAALPPPPQGAAPDAAVHDAARRIHDARRPVLLIGMRGAEPAACAAVRELISVTGIPVVEKFQAAGVVSRRLEQHYLGRVGLFRNQPGDVVIAEADVLVAVGYDAVEYDPRLWNSDSSRTVVHIDAVAADVDNHYQPAIELRGDVAATVSALTAQMSGFQLDAGYRAELSRQRDALRSIDVAAASTPASGTGLNPAAVVLRLRDELDDDATITCDIGTVYIHVARHLRVYEPRRLLFSNGQQTLGVALPWAMAAALLRPGTQVVSISGDGGFLFSASELETAHRLGLSLVHVVLRDNTYDMVGFQELLKYGRTSGVQLGDYNVIHYAAAFGASGHRVGTLEEFSATLREALSEPGPSLIDVPVDYSRSTDLAKHLQSDVFE